MYFAISPGALFVHFAIVLPGLLAALAAALVPAATKAFLASFDLHPRAGTIEQC